MSYEDANHTGPDQAPAPEEPPASGGDAGAGAPEADAEPDLSDALLADVYSLTSFALGLFVQQAWISLGLRNVPGTSETRLRLDQARVAIDAAAFLLDRLKPALEPAEQRQVELELTNLRLNFAQRAGQTSEADSPGTGHSG